MSTASSSTWNWPSPPRTCCCSSLIRYRAQPLVVVPWNERTALADEEVEVGALVGLLYVVEIKAPIAALERRLGRLPFRLSLLQFGVGNEELDLPFRDIELDHVAVLHQREHAAGGRFGRYVQHHGAVRRATHARVRNAHYVGDALLQELRRQRHVANFRHAGVALRPAVLQHHDAALVDVELRIVDAPMEVLDVLEHHRAPLVPEELRRG